MTGWNDWTLTQWIIYNLDEGGMAGSTSMYGFRDHFFRQLSDDGKERAMRLMTYFVKRIAAHEGSILDSKAFHKKSRRLTDFDTFSPRPKVSKKSPVASEEHLALILTSDHYVARLLYAAIDIGVPGAEETARRLLADKKSHDRSRFDICSVDFAGPR